MKGIIAASLASVNGVRVDRDRTQPRSGLHLVLGWPATAALSRRADRTEARWRGAGGNARIPPPFCRGRRKEIHTENTSVDPLANWTKDPYETIFKERFLLCSPIDLIRFSLASLWIWRNKQIGGFLPEEQTIPMGAFASLIYPLLHLMDHLKSMKLEEPNAVQAGIFDNGYPSSIIVLAVTVFESAVSINPA